MTWILKLIDSSIQNGNKTVITTSTLNSSWSNRFWENGEQLSENPERNIPIKHWSHNTYALFYTLTREKTQCITYQTPCIAKLFQRMRTFCANQKTLFQCKKYERFIWMEWWDNFKQRCLHPRLKLMFFVQFFKVGDLGYLSIKKLKI